MTIPVNRSTELSRSGSFDPERDKKAEVSISARFLSPKLAPDSIRGRATLAGSALGEESGGSSAGLEPHDRYYQYAHWPAREPRHADGLRDQRAQCSVALYDRPQLEF